MAPIPELTATLRVLVVPWALPSSECECEVLTVEGSVTSRNARGGTAPTQVASQLGVVRDAVEELRIRLRR